MAMTYYDVLGVLPSATADEIRAVWRGIARTCHPDVTSEPWKIERFKTAADAKAVLLDPDQRAAYDADLWREQEERRQEGFLCRKCGGVRVANEGATCLVCQVISAPRPKPKPKPKPRRMKRKIHLDLDLDAVPPAWSMQGGTTDEVMAQMMAAAALRRRSRRSRTRLEIPVGDVVVVVDESTLDALDSIAKTTAAMGKIAKAVSRWLR